MQEAANWGRETSKLGGRQEEKVQLEVEEEQLLGG